MKLRITYNAPVVLTFALAAVAAFVVSQLVGQSAQQWFVAYPKLGPAQSYAGLVTHILGHASWQHLLANFMLILLIGPILEERHGSLALLVMILVTALITGLANLVIGSHMLLGASGVAFMMILLASMA
ncbi:MAG: rhomboid family intramembrane serine protease, partial [Kofleriaceae bacterium]